MNPEVAAKNGYYRNITDQHLMVWYQMESFSDFKKLYGSIEGTLFANKTYYLSIKDTYDAKALGSKKYIFITEVGLFGGRNLVIPGIFFGCAFIIFCILLLFFACYFVKLHKKDRYSEDFINSLTY